jgi:putative ABC transport system permease protein
MVSLILRKHLELRLPFTSLSQIRHASRVLLKSPGFALASILTLTLGIGVTSSIFSVVYGVLLKRTPYRDPEHLCLLWKSVPKKNLDRDWTSYPTYEDWKHNERSFDDLAAFLRPDGSIVNLTGTNDVEQVQSTKVSGNFFSVLGTPALLGRSFTASEIAGNPHLAVISYEFWRQHFSSAKDVIGRKMEIDGVSFEVIGVMPAEFAFPAKESQAWSQARDTELWLPIESDARWAAFQKFRIADAFGVVARLHRNTSIDQAQAEMTTIAGQLAREYPDTDRYLGVHVVPLAIYLVGSRVRLTLGLFMGAVIAVLLMACANVAALFVSRTFARRQSMAIRIALGAGRSDIFRQVMTEAILLALVAGTAGLGLAVLGVRALIIVAPFDLPGLHDVRVNGYVVLFTMGVSLLTGALSAFRPAWELSKANPQDALREKGESNRHSNRMHSSLVFIECTLAIVLLTGTGLLLRSAIRLQSVDLGFRPDHLVVENIVLHGDKYDNDDARIRSFVYEAIGRVGVLPGVKSAAVGSVFLGRVPNSQLEVEERQGATSTLDDEPATWTYVSERFFETLEIPILRGRQFTSSDGPVAMPVVIVSETMARRLWPGRDPIGRRFKYNAPGSESKGWLTVIGVAGDTVRNGPETRPISVIYFPVRQKVWDVLTLMVRTQSSPSSMEAAIDNQIHQIDRTLPRTTPSTVEEQLWSLGAQRRFQIELLTLFSLLAVVLAAVGIYGVMAYAMGQRTREIGIRMALGAQRGDVLLMILRQALLPVGMGLLAGLAIALAISRAFAGLLYDVTATDPVSYVSVCLFLLTIAAIAAYIPAHRATRVDPLVALRYE